MIVDMNNAHLLQELLAVYAVGLALVVGLSRLRVPPVVALILTGLLAGPSGLGLVQDVEHLDELAEIGVVLLLFTVGLEFSLTELRRIWRTLVAGGALQMMATTALVVAILTGADLFAPASAVLLGVFVAMSSTAVVIRALAERNEVNAPHGRLTVGVLLFQDLAIVVALLLVPVLSGQVAIEAVPGLLVRAAAALVAVGVIGRLLLPPLLRAVIRARRREAFAFALLIASVGTAWLCARFGLPTAVGAFFGGLVLAESEFSHQAYAEIRPIRDLLASLFFISLGMMVDLPTMASSLGPLALTVTSIILVKATLAALVFLTLRQPVRTSTMAALALAQVGEFSFILGREGLHAGLIDGGTWQLLLAASAVTMLLTPPALAIAPRAGTALARLLGRSTPDEPGARVVRRDHVVVLGYGLGGRLIAAALENATRSYFVLELNGGTVIAAARAGVPIAYGDATNPDALEAAGVAVAAAVVVVLTDPEAARGAVRATRRLAPEVPVIVRTRYRSEAERLRTLGATAVVVEELEGSLEALGHLLARLGFAGNRIEAMLETLRHDAVARPRRAPDTLLAELPGLLRDASVATDELGTGDWAVGRSIVETTLRAATGASVVAMVRGTDYLASPSPDQRLEAGDLLYLVGTREAVDRARSLLRTGA
jgi:CPA2 family monovalent cation:H+ antiporter-2